MVNFPTVYIERLSIFILVMFIVYSYTVSKSVKQLLPWSFYHSTKFSLKLLTHLFWFTTSPLSDSYFYRTINDIGVPIVSRTFYRPYLIWGQLDFNITLRKWLRLFISSPLKECVCVFRCTYTRVNIIMNTTFSSIYNI